MEPIYTLAVTNTFPQPQIAVFVLTLWCILRDRRKQRDVKTCFNYQLDAQFLYSELSPLSTGAPHGRSHRVTIPNAVETQF
jgi:hypothetical protein